MSFSEVYSFFLEDYNFYLNFLIFRHFYIIYVYIKNSFCVILQKLFNRCINLLCPMRCWIIDL